MSRFKKTPRQIMSELCERAFWSGMMALNPKNKGKPGEFYQNRTTEEEKETLKSLKSEDLANFRPYPMA